MMRPGFSRLNTAADNVAVPHTISKAKTGVIAGSTKPG
jgi:hypothetical protein